MLESVVYRYMEIKGGKIKTVAFTGHRNIEHKYALRLPTLLEQIISELAVRGATVFRAGGAMGFDTIAALKVLDMQKTHPDFELELILPCKDQTERWDEISRRTYDYILANSTRYDFLYTSYIDGCMLERDRILIDKSDVCVAYCAHSHGGTAYTSSYALKAWS